MNLDAPYIINRLAIPKSRANHHALDQHHSSRNINIPASFSQLSSPPRRNRIKVSTTARLAFPNNTGSFWRCSHELLRAAPCSSHRDPPPRTTATFRSTHHHHHSHDFVPPSRPDTDGSPPITPLNSVPEFPLFYSIVCCIVDRVKHRAKTSLRRDIHY